MIEENVVEKKKKEKAGFEQDRENKALVNGDSRSEQSITDLIGLIDGPQS